MCFLSYAWNPSIFKIASVSNEPIAELIRSKVEISSEYNKVTADTRVLDELTKLQSLHCSMCLVFIRLTVLSMQLQHPHI